MNGLYKYRSLSIHLPALLALLVLTGCQQSDQAELDTQSGQLMLPAPAVLGLRAYDPEALQLSVTVDGNTVNMSRNGTDDNWTGTINVNQNATHDIVINWSERYANLDLPLASATTTVDTGTQGLSVTLNPEWDVTADNDSDGFGNLAERNAGTDPLDPDSKPEPEEPVDVRIARINPNDAPALDGLGVSYSSNAFSLVGEWSQASASDTEGNDLLINSLMIDRGADQTDNTPAHRWVAMHDGTWLYVLVVVDDIGLNYADSSGIWKDDNLEIFIDADNSKHTSWGQDDNDRHVHIGLMLNPSNRANSSSLPRPRIVKGANSANLPGTDSIEFAVGLGTGPASLRRSSQRQDVYEIRLNLAAWDIEIGKPFGFELQLDDDDDGGDRDAKWGWFHPARRTIDTDLTWQNPSIMGTVILEP